MRNQLVTALFVCFLIILIKFNVSAQDNFINNNHIGLNFQVNTIKSAGYKNPLLKLESFNSIGFNKFVTKLNLGHYFKYDKNIYYAKHFYTFEVEERYELFRNYYFGLGLNLSSAQIANDKQLQKHIIVSFSRSYKTCIVGIKYLSPDQSKYHFQLVSIPLEYFYKLNEKFYVYLKEEPFIHKTVLSSSTGNNFVIGFVYKLK